ncbi:hypothetical protein N7G274_004270 [Stereocaulon virgatum]|uniref:Uncharacterized protein n=1 Tax=Stereocaulon virgatum TaxID=373712 RepID=A0ABR4ACI9_9LECA
MSKNTLDPDLRVSASSVYFDSLLSTTDIFLDGYRPSALICLSYGPSRLTEFARSRKKSLVGLPESCFGALPPSSTEPAGSE